jgi:hypothetical protein
MGQKLCASVQRVFWISAIGIMFIVQTGCANMQEKPSDRSPGATETRRREDQLARARQLLFEVEHSPSANLDELRNRLHQAQDETAAVLKVNPDDAEALELSHRIEDLLSKLGRRPHDDHPWVAEAEATLNRLTTLVKGGGSRSEVEALHTHLRKLAKRIEGYKAADAAKYQQSAEELWGLYANRLTRINGICPGCATLDLTSLAEGVTRPRLLGAGDYTLDDLEAMKVQGFTTLLTGDFNRDDTPDVALIGRDDRGGKKRLFVLIASVQKNGYQRLFLETLEWDKAALTTQDGTLILSEIFYASDDFWKLIWNGKTFEFHYAGEDMGQDCSKVDFLSPSCAEELIMDLPEVQSLAEEISKHKGVTPIIIVESEPDPNANPGTEEAAFRVYFGEDHKTHTVRVLTFSVDAQTRKIFVYNDALSQRIPYEEWKKKKK